MERGAVLGSTTYAQWREGQDRVVVFVVQLQWTKGLLQELMCQPESNLKVSGS